MAEARSSWQPPAVVVHGALIGAQLCFGVGSIVGKFGISGTNPVLFALIREGLAGPILCLCAFWMTKTILPRKEDLLRLILCGLCIFINQFGYIVGLKLSDPVSAAAWQPSQPIWTVLIVCLIGMEDWSVRKVLGVVLSVAGAVFMVVYGSSAQGNSGWEGHIFFFFNCMGTSLYVILSKPLCRSGTYKAVSITAWSYIVASLTMLPTVLIFNAIPTLTNFICTDKDPAVQQTCVEGKWDVPASMIWPLAYWILFNSILAYFLMTWGNQFAPASAVSGYTVLQPFTSEALCALLIAVAGSSWADKYNLEKPGLQFLGAIAIVLGLAVLLSERAVQREDLAAKRLTESAA